mmetsp:Transcript_47047/g.131146  ORF Transcript_47047/g.131146 Transcript_47047/m.131146 type:complete len:214 (-) Transcript_47047:217-858(-)
MGEPQASCANAPVECGLLILCAWILVQAAPIEENSNLAGAVDAPVLSDVLLHDGPQEPQLFALRIRVVWRTPAMRNYHDDRAAHRLYGENGLWGHLLAPWQDLAAFAQAHEPRASHQQGVARTQHCLERASANIRLAPGHVLHLGLIKRVVAIVQLGSNCARAWGGRLGIGGRARRPGHDGGSRRAEKIRDAQKPERLWLLIGERRARQRCLS